MSASTSPITDQQEKLSFALILKLRTSNSAAIKARLTSWIESVDSHASRESGEDLVLALEGHLLEGFEVRINRKPPDTSGGRIPTGVVDR